MDGAESARLDAFDRVFVYGTGGFAYGGVSGGFSNSSNTRTGWTAGGGVEWLFIPNWSAKVEYLYYDLGSKNYSVIGGTLPAVSAKAKMDGSIVRAGLNYKF